MGLQPSKPDDAGGDCIGALKLDGSGTCGCSRPYVFPDGGLCAPSPPTSDEWKAAWKELGPVFDAVDAEIDKAIPEMGCCGVQGELAKVREHLERDWMVKVKAVLKAHGLTAKLHDTWVYNGQSSSQELFLYVYEMVPSDAVTDAPAEPAAAAV